MKTKYSRVRLRRCEMKLKILMTFVKILTALIKTNFITFESFIFQYLFNVI